MSIFELFHTHQRKGDTACFVLDDTLYVHLGDQLFWAPAIIALRNAGFPIKVHLPQSLKDFWKINRITIEQGNWQYDKNTIYFTYKPFLLTEKLWTVPTICADLTDTNIPERITVHLCKEVFQRLGLTEPTIPKLLFPTQLSSSIIEVVETQKKHIWLVNDQLDSGFFRQSMSQRHRIWNKAKQLKKQGNLIAYVGTFSASHHFDQSIVDIDMRGQTTPDEIFPLLQHPRVSGTISYDNFLMHACLLAQKKSYVMFRGRFRQKAEQHHYEKVNCAFGEVDKNLITYL